MYQQYCLIGRAVSTVLPLSFLHMHCFQTPISWADMQINILKQFTTFFIFFLIKKLVVQVSFKISDNTIK